MVFLAIGPGTGTSGHGFQKFLPSGVHLKACIARFGGFDCLL